MNPSPEQGRSQPQEEAEAIAAKVRAYLRRHAGASPAELTSFLMRECAFSFADAQALTQRIVVEIPGRAEKMFLARSLGAGAAEFVKGMDMRRLNWAYIVGRALRLGVAPLLYKSLLEAAAIEQLPLPIAEQLESSYHHSARVNQALYTELGQILHVLHKEKIEVVLLKGIALAPILYQDVAARPMNDLDLLVSPEDVECAETALRGIGYQLSPLAPSFRPPGFLRQYGGSAEYARQVNGERRLLDLHWQLTHSEWIRRTTRVQAIHLRETSRPWSYGDLQARQLSPLYHLFYSALHLLKHKFSPAAWRGLADIDRLMHVYVSELDSLETARDAEKYGIATALYVVLELCARGLGTPVSAEMRAALAPLHWRQTLLRHVLSINSADLPDAEIRGWRKFFFESLLLDEPFSLPYYLYRLLFPEREWLMARYDLEDRPQAYWRYRIAHPFKVLRSGEL